MKEQLVAVHTFVPGQTDDNGSLTLPGRYQTRRLAQGHLPVSPPILAIAGTDKVLAETLAAAEEGAPSSRTSAQTLEGFRRVLNPREEVAELLTHPMPPTVRQMLLTTYGETSKARMTALLEAISREAVELLRAHPKPEQFLIEPRNMAHVIVAGHRLFVELAVPSPGESRCLKPGGSVTYFLAVGERVRFLSAKISEPFPLVAAEAAAF